MLASPSIYAARGDLQLIIRHLEPLGQGALQLAFEQLRSRLEAEGLFDPAAKRPLPPWPRRIGVVTSPQGAAIRDVIEVSGQRLASVPLLVAPSRVQGDGAERELCRALEAVARAPDVDVVLLVRGGGSLEDLQAFNTEPLARAIRACPVPVICGVGHEVDWTIADHAADHRAATPSAAAMVALPDAAALGRGVAALHARLAAALQHRIDDAQDALTHASELLRAFSPRARLAARQARVTAAQRQLALQLRGAVPERRRHLEGATARLVPAARAAIPLRGARLRELQRRLAHAMRSRLADDAARFARTTAQLDALSPLAVLGRGYAIVQPEGESRVVRAAREVEVGDTVEMRLSEGRLRARVTERLD